MLLVAFMVNLATGFVQFGFSLTLPSMEEVLHISHTEEGRSGWAAHWLRAHWPRATAAAR